MHEERGLASEQIKEIEFVLRVFPNEYPSEIL